MTPARPPRRYISQGERKTTIEVLLSGGAEIEARDENGSTALHLAAQDGNKDEVRILLAHCADVKAKNVKGRTALHEAACKGSEAEKGYESTIQMLIEHGSDIEARDGAGLTALQLADIGFRIVSLGLECVVFENRGAGEVGIGILVDRELQA